jgi:hypothetical protein
MAFSVDREGGDTNMTYSRTMHPLPPTLQEGRVNGVPNPRIRKFFENNYFMKGYE